jgi:hypothetical protein
MIPSVGRLTNSKRKQYLKYCEYVAKSTKRIIEPFASFLYFSLLCAEKGFEGDFWFDFNDEILAHLFGLIIKSPEFVSDGYEKLWSCQFDFDKDNYFNCLKEKYEYVDFTEKAVILSFLIQKSKKDLTEDNATYGRKPKSMRETLKRISFLLKDRTKITVKDIDVFKGRAEDTYFLENVTCLDKNVQKMIENGAGFIMVLEKDLGEKKRNNLVSKLKSTTNIHFDYINNVICSKGAG